MMRIVQISDLHFGTVRHELTGPLTEVIRQARPDLIVMAGDFVQRARTGQFRAARGFMDSLGAPWIGVPGNHDIPLYNIFARLTAPYRKYHAWISHDREPWIETSDAVIIGIDTTDPLRWQRGRIRGRQIDRVCRAIMDEDGRRTVIVAAHHPFHQRADIEKKLMLAAPEALDAWSSCGPHVILSGHLHSWLVEPFVTRRGDRQTLQVHSGTGLSKRQRGEPNDFAILEVDGAEVSVTRMAAAPDMAVFRPTGRDIFERTDRGWSRRSRRIAPRAVSSA